MFNKLKTVHRFNGRKKANLIVAMLVILPGIAAAQFLLTPESLLLDHNLIRPAHDFQKVIVFDPEGRQQLQFMNESIIQIDSAKGAILFSRFRQYPYGTQHLDTSIARLANLAPMHLHSFDTPLKKELVIQFTDTAVKVQRRLNGILKDTNFVMEHGYFDDNTIEVFIGYLKLQKGVTYRLNAYRFESGGNNPYQLEYLFDDYIATTGKDPEKCAVIKYTNQYASGFIWYRVLTGKMVKEIAVTKTGSYLVLEN